jgi:hypothetical protein
MLIESIFGRRVRWYILRSPFAPLLKWLLRSTIRPELRERRELAAGLGADDATDRIAAEVNRDGYAFVTPLLDPAALETLGAAAQDLLTRAKERPVSQLEQHKSFWTRLLDEEMTDGTLPSDSPFVAFALQQPILKLMSKVFGELPQLESVLLTYSQPAEAPLAYSQLWHFDYDDPRVIKLFVYLTDVDTENDGPFTFIPKGISKRFRSSLRSRLSDATVSKRAPGGVKSLKAPRLSAFVVETSRCLHMGSRLAPGHERLLYTATFLALPRLYPEPAPRFVLAGDETPSVKSVLRVR